MRRILAILVCFVLAINALSVAPARALEVTTTPTTEFSEAAPLLITAYQTAADATELVIVEVYNQADNPVDMRHWDLKIMTKESTVLPLAYETNHPGVLLPNEHTTISMNPKSTYQLSPYTSKETITAIELHSNDERASYKAVVAPVKDTSDAPFFRTYTPTGYYSTGTQPFATMSIPRHFYDDGLYEPPTFPVDLTIIEIYPYASDCAPNDASLLCGDYVKLKNTGDRVVNLEELALRTDYYGSNRSESNTILLHGELSPGATTLVNTTNDGDALLLTNSGGYIWLEDAWNMARFEETMQKYESAGSDKQGYAYARDANDVWWWTTTPQPSGDNIVTYPVEIVAECPEGKYRNPETGRCRTIEEAVNALTECEEGYERNPVTNRCRKIVMLAGAVVAPCKEGQERNPATNRCRSIASAVAELLPCDEGYERNSDTNRCRKVTNDTVPQAAFPVVPVRGSADAAGWYALAAVGAAAAGYAIWEWRVEIAGALKRLFGVLRRSK